MKRIVIGVITRERPKMLLRALDCLRFIEIPPNVDVHLILVDNNKDGSAKDVFEAVSLPFPQHYFIEKKQGIPFARNRVLDESYKLRADYLAFFDDDTIVDKYWLQSLFAASLKYKSAAVHGLVCYDFPENTPWWIRKHNSYRLSPFKTGDSIGNGGTNNILYDLMFLGDKKIRFDERFVFSGGTDTFLAFDIVRSGGVIVFCREAIIYETVSKDRSTLAWVTRRRYRMHCNRVIKYRRYKNWFYAFRVSYRLLIKSFYKSLLFFTAFLLRRKRIFFVKSLDHAACFLGTITGLLGGRYNEYRKVYGE